MQVIYFMLLLNKGNMQLCANLFGQWQNSRHLCCISKFSKSNWCIFVL